MHLDQDEIRSYEQRAFFEKKQVSETNPLSIFFAVLGAILVSWFIREAYLEWQVQRALTIFNQQMQNMNAQTQQQLQHLQIQTEAAKAEAQERVRLEMEAKVYQRQQAIQLENDQNAQKIALIQEQEAREIAWRKFYKPINGCESENTNRDAIKCGNHYIRERRRFDANWVSMTNIQTNP